MEEKILGRVVSKEGHADSFLGYEKPIIINFLEKVATLRKASYCKILWQNSPYLLNDPGVCVCVCVCVCEYIYIYICFFLFCFFPNINVKIST